AWAQFRRGGRTIRASPGGSARRDGSGAGPETPTTAAWPGLGTNQYTGSEITVYQEVFRERLHAPLLAIELSYNNGYELQEGDAEILVQVRGGAVLWQKERLLNVALAALPETCRYVAWVDCDILFEVDDWTQSLSSLLERFMIVQLFKDKHYLCRHLDPRQSNGNQVEHTLTSAAFLIASGRSSAACFWY